MYADSERKSPMLLLLTAIARRPCPADIERKRAYFNLPNAKSATVLWNVSEDFAAGIIIAVAPVILRDDIEIFRESYIKNKVRVLEYVEKKRETRIFQDQALNANEKNFATEKLCSPALRAD